MGWLVAFFFAICTGLLVLVLIVQRDEHRKRGINLRQPLEEASRWEEPRGDRLNVSPGSQHAGRGPTAAAPVPVPAINPPDVDCVLADRYRIVATIGRGGMGVVYRAWDRVAERYTVIKMPRPDLMVDGSVRERFRRELEMVRSLDHPSIVPVLAVGEFHAVASSDSDEPGTPFAVMPYLAGGSLQRRHRRRRSEVLPLPGSLWDWLPEVADAMDHVHSRGLLHRDVKPANVLFDGLGRPYLGDFGVAKAAIAAEGLAPELTQAGFAVGTPTYMAPELVAGTAVDARSDQYALAVMVFECVAGRPPFAAATPAAVLWQQATVPAPRLDSIRADLPGSLVEAVNRGLKKSPDERFPSCAGFVAAVLADVRKPVRPRPPKLMCPDCGKLLNARHQWAGRRGRCPNCRAYLEISTDLQSLWLRRDRDERPRFGGRRHRRPLPHQLEWIDRNGLLMTVVLTMFLAAVTAMAWGLRALILAALVAVALAAWWLLSPPRIFGKNSTTKERRSPEP